MNPLAGIDLWTLFKMFARLAFDFVFCLYAGVVVGCLVATAALLAKWVYCRALGKAWIEGSWE